jgi:hypothetical protein
MRLLGSVYLEEYPLVALDNRTEERQSLCENQKKGPTRLLKNSFWSAEASVARLRFGLASLRPPKESKAPWPLRSAGVLHISLS